MKKFSIYDLVIISIMAALGIAVKPIVVPLAHLISGPLMIPSGSLAGGFYMMWLVIGAGMVRKAGTGTLIAFVQAILVTLIGVAGSHGILSLVSYTLPGLMMDGVLLLMGHSVCCRPCAFISGAVANVTGTLAVNFIFFQLPGLFLLLTSAVALCSGGVGGLIAWELLKVLNNYHLIGSGFGKEKGEKKTMEGIGDNGTD